jgi:hypothetical protein
MQSGLFILFVQSGALLVSHDGFITFLAIVQCEANPSLQCTRTQPSYFNNTGGTSKRIMTSILPLKMPTDYKSVPPVSLTILCYQHYKANLFWHVREEIIFNSITNQRSPSKILKPPSTLI